MLGSRPSNLAFCAALPLRPRDQLREAFADAGVLLERCPGAIERSDVGALGIGHWPPLDANFADMAARLQLGPHLALLLWIGLFQGGGDQLADIFGYLRMRWGDCLSRVILAGCRHNDGPACVNDNSFGSLQLGEDADPGKPGSGIAALDRGLSPSYGVGSEEQREQCATGKDEIPHQRNFIADQSIVVDRPTEDFTHSTRLPVPERRSSHSEFFATGCMFTRDCSFRLMPVFATLRDLLRTLKQQNVGSP